MDDGPRDLPDDGVKDPGHELEGGEEEAGAVSILLGLQTDGLVVVDFYGLVDVVLDEGLEDGAVDFAEELAGVDGVLGDDDEAVVVDDVAL